MSSSGAVTLDNVADKITMLEVACSRCERHGRLSVAKLIERHGADSQLTNLRTVRAGDCPRIGGVIYDQCGVHYPQLVRLGLNDLLDLSRRFDGMADSLDPQPACSCCYVRAIRLGGTNGVDPR